MATKKTTQEPRAYLLRGDDDYQKNAALKDLIAQLVSGDLVDFDFEEMDSDAATSERIISGVCIPPLGSARRVVLVKHAQRIDPREQEQLAAGLGKVPDSGCLILLTPAPDKQDGRPKKGSEVLGNLSRAVRKVGKVLEFGNERPRDKMASAVEFARSIFAQAGRKVAPGAIELLLQRVGTDFSTIDSEVRKLIDYSADTGKISRADVANVTSETQEDRIFALVDAIAERDQPRALAHLDNLFRVGSDPNAEAPRALSLIARQYRYIQQTMLIRSHRVSSMKKENVPEHVLTLLPSSENVTDLVTRQYWQENKLIKQANRLTQADMFDAFQAIAKCDLRLKGIADIDDARIAMELLVTELSRPRRAAY